MSESYSEVVQATNAIEFGENSITCRWFNSPYISKMLAVGMEVILYGKPKDVSGKLVIDHPEFEVKCVWHHATAVKGDAVQSFANCG